LHIGSKLSQNSQNKAKILHIGSKLSQTLHIGSESSQTLHIGSKLSQISQKKESLTYKKNVILFI